MNEIEVIDLVLNQIGDVRIALRDDDTRARLTTACQNLDALREALLKNREVGEAVEASEEVTEDV